MGNNKVSATIGKQIYERLPMTLSLQPKVSQRLPAKPGCGQSFRRTSGVSVLLLIGCGGRSALDIDAQSSDLAFGGSPTAGNAGGTTSFGGAAVGLNPATGGTGGAIVGAGGSKVHPTGGAGAMGGFAGTGGIVSAPHAAAVSAGNNYTCALISNGTIKCWGSNESGRLGIGSATSSVLPSQMVVGITAAIAVATGDLHACALINDGTIQCWGANDDGQLGDGTTTSSSIPVSVRAITNAIAVTAGYRHTCALLSDYTASCWGDNSQGQLGADSSIYSSSTPVPYTQLYNGMVAIEAGRSHTCAIPISSAGSVTCWGSNSEWQLGSQDVTGISYQPIWVNGVNSAIAIAAGDQHNCALIAGPDGGTVQCWGWNYYGQLGTGGFSDNNLAANVYGISTAISITAADHSCALLNDQHVQCWGFNSSGELGDGSTIARSTPVAVQNLSNVVQVSVGSVHSCALLSNHQVECWGDNAYGELGDGTQTMSTVPIAVLGL